MKYLIKPCIARSTCEHHRRAEAFFTRAGALCSRCMELTGARWLARAEPVRVLRSLWFGRVLLIKITSSASGCADARFSRVESPAALVSRPLPQVPSPPPPQPFATGEQAIFFPWSVFHQNPLGGLALRRPQFPPQPNVLAISPGKSHEARPVFRGFDWVCLKWASAVL